MKPRVPPRHSSLKANYEQATADLSAQLPTDGTKVLTSDQSFRQMSPLTLLRRPEQTNWTSYQVHLDNLFQIISSS